MKKRIKTILLTLLLAVFCVVPVFASEFNQEVLESIVYVEEDIVVSGQFLGAMRGTGFFIGEKGKDPQYLVTNHHVIADYIDCGGGESGNESRLFVAFSQTDVEEAYVVEYNEKMDLALLRLAKATSKRKPLRINDKFSVGDRVYAVGFPKLSEDLVNSTSSFSIDDASVTSGSISRLLTESGTGRRLIQIDASIYGGNSGGPLVDVGGNVIGINTMGLEGMNYAVSIEELIPILDRNNVSYDTGSDPVVPDDPIVPDDPVEPAPAISPIIIIAIMAAVVVVIVMVVLIIVLKGKKAQPAPMPQPQPQPQRRPVIYSVLPEHGGMRISVEGRTIQLGRDPASCQIAFRDGTPGVSKHHCQVSWDASRGEFSVMDMKSSYGTFLGNGQRLNAGVAYYIRPGESFYLGDRANEIRTELG